MKFDWLKQVRFFSLVALAVLLISAACAPAAAPTAAPQTAAEAVTVPTNTQAAAPVEKAPASPTSTTAAPAATATVETKKVESTAPSATPAPTETKAAAAPVVSGPEVGAYCFPLNASVTNIKEPLNPPSSVKIVKSTTNSLEVSGLPANGCVFYYTFKGGAPTGLQLEVSMANQAKPFLKVDLKPVDGNPETVWALVRHAMIVSPTAKSLSVVFVVRDPLGQVVRQDPANLNSWVGGTPEPGGSDDDCGCDVPVLP